MTTITIDRAVVEQALEALEAFLSDELRPYEAAKISDALRAALAQQAEPVEPVAWMESPHGAIRANPLCKIQFPSQLLSWQIPLYTAPPQQAEPVEPVDVGLLEYRGNSVAFIHQKMTAYRTGIDVAWDAFRAKGLHPDGKTSLADMIAKHTAPPKRKPLMDEEIDKVSRRWVPVAAYMGLHEHAEMTQKQAQQSIRSFARAIERAHGIGDNT